MPQVVTFFEHETKIFNWSDCDLGALGRLNKQVGSEILRPVVQANQHCLKAHQHVGVIRLGNRTIQILPKIYRTDTLSDEIQHAREATRNLLHMLAYAGHLPIREQAIAPLLQRDCDWFEILTHLFVTHLMEEWQRGAHHAYRIIEDNLSTLKGKWRIAEQIRRPEQKHRFYVAYDEFTADNSLNRIFRFVVERLWHVTNDSDNRRHLGELRQWMDEVTLLHNVTIANADTLLLTRLNCHYEPLLNLARLFLGGSTLQFAAGNLTMFALVFDMNLLFQEFIVSFIRRHREEILSPALQQCDLVSQSRGIQYYLATHEDSKPIFRLIPDLSFRAPDHTFPLLLDTKYKSLDPNNSRLGIDQSDLYQVYAYSHKYSCPRIIMLFPQAAGLATPLKTSFTFETDRDVQVATIDIRRDLSLAIERSSLKQDLYNILGV